jgi:hypothetical protein
MNQDVNRKKEREIDKNDRKRKSVEKLAGKKEGCVQVQRNKKKSANGAKSFRIPSA